jgi:phosphatidyl-myo-inositol dimannoside synthase
VAYRLVLVTEGLNGQKGGIQRVSREVIGALKHDPAKAIVWSSNDKEDKEIGRLGEKGMEGQAGIGIRWFEKKYLKMGWAALTGPLPVGCQKIICWHLALSPIAAILALRLHCPFHIFLHGIEAWGQLTLPQRWALSRAASIAANSQHTLDRFRKTHPEYERMDGKVLRLGLSEEFVAISKQFQRNGAHLVPLPEEEDRNPFSLGENVGIRGNQSAKQRPFFLTVTRLDEAYKGVKNLIDAFSRVHKEHSEVQLRIVGEGPMKQELVELTKSLHLDSSVIFLGGISDKDLSALYQNSLAFILLSKGEGFGIAYLEAMFHGIPCVATNVDAAQELIKNDETGFTVSPGDIGATVEIMRKIIQNPDTRKRLGDEARRRVIAEFMPYHFQQRLREWMTI